MVADKRVIPVGFVVALEEDSADPQSDPGWFRDDLAIMPTQILPPVPQTSPTRWMNPKPELMTRILEALRKL